MSMMLAGRNLIGRMPCHCSCCSQSLLERGLRMCLCLHSGPQTGPQHDHATGCCVRSCGAYDCTFLRRSAGWHASLL